MCIVELIHGHLAEEGEPGVCIYTAVDSSVDSEMVFEL